MTYLIGDPSVQENEEWEWPLYRNGALVDFFPNIPAAARAGATLDAIADIPAGNTDEWHCPLCGGALYLKSPCSCGSSVAPDSGICLTCSNQTEDVICPVCEKPAAVLNENNRCEGCEETARWIMEMWAAGKCPACQQEGHDIKQCPEIAAYDTGFLIRVPGALLIA